MVDVALAQLDKIKSLALDGYSFRDSVFKMDLDLLDQDLMVQLQVAHDMGKDEREEKVYTEEETKRNAQIFFDPLLPLVIKHKLDENPINRQTVPDIPLQEEFNSVRDKVMGGDKEYLYTAILSQLGQMQQMSIKINERLSQKNTVDKAMKYSNIQLKLMAEQRRTIQALADLMTPKKTTFVKEVSQHNHFSEKKDDKQNELSQPQDKEIIDAHQYTEAEAITT